MAVTYNDLFQAELEKAIGLEIEKLKDDVVSGNFSQEEYRYRVGQVAGLKLVLDLCADVKTKMDER